METPARTLNERRTASNHAARLALAAVEAERSAGEITASIETEAWNTADEAYARLCEALALATTAHTVHTQIDEWASERIGRAITAIHQARACGWWPRVEPGKNGHDEAELAETTRGICAAVLQDLATDETRYSDILTCARTAADTLGLVARSVHPLNAATPGPNDGGKIVIVVSRANEQRPLARRERAKIEEGTRIELAGYGIEDLKFEVTNVPLERERWYHVQCTQNHIEKAESAMLAPNAGAARRRAHWNGSANGAHDWRDGHIDPTSFAVGEIVPLAMAHRSCCDGLEDPPNGYVEPG